MALSGHIPGILTNRLAIRTHTPRNEEGEELRDVDLVIEFDVDGALSDIVNAIAIGIIDIPDIQMRLSTKYAASHQ